MALGLEWHSKMLLRIEIAGTIINSYDTYQHWFEETGAFGLDYFIGGLVTGGLAFQPSGTLSLAPQFDEQIGSWMGRYKRYGHAMEDGVRTLYYDEECCHIQGVCEWTACQDIVLSRLSGGTDTTTVHNSISGLYLGSKNHVTVPPAWLNNSGALLVFMAHGLSTATVDLGSPADQTVTLIPTAATNATKGSAAAARSIVLSGGFFELESEDILLTWVNETGSKIRSKWLFGNKAMTGQQSYTMELAVEDAPGALSAVFEKHKKTA